MRRSVVENGVLHKLLFRLILEQRQCKSIINRPVLFPLQIRMGNEYPIFREYKFVLLEFPWCKLLVR